MTALAQKTLTKNELAARVAIYVRVSGEEQREAQTIENQIHFAEEACRRRGYLVVDTYRDDGVSGTIPLRERPEGARLLADAKAGRFGAITVYRLDRLARTTLIILRTQEELDQYGVSIVSLTEPFDATTPAGRLFLQMLASVAEFDRESILERMRLGKDRRRREGKRTGARPLLGYVADNDGYMVIEESEAEVIRTIFRLYVDEGMNCIEIADYLTARGVPTPASFKRTHPGHREVWLHSTISSILRNPAYRGEFHYSKRDGDEAIASIPAIISPETWLQAAEIRKKNSKNARRNAKHSYLLRGLVRCRDCGSNFAGCWVGKRVFTYYRCVGTENRHRILPEKCRVPMIRTDQLEQAVWADIVSFVRDPGPLLKELEARVDAELATPASIDTELADLERTIEAKAAERQRLIRLYRTGKISETEADSELDQLANEITALDARKSAILNRDTERQLMRSQVINTQVLLEQLHNRIEGADFATRRQLVEALVEKIEVETVIENGKRRPKVTVSYRFGPPDQNKHCGVADWMATAS